MGRRRRSAGGHHCTRGVLAAVVRRGRQRRGQRRGRRLVGDLGGRPRRHGRAGQGRAEGGDAQRHRAAARLGELRQHHHGLRGQVRHQGQLRAAGRSEPGRDRCRQPAQGHRQGTRRLRPGAVRRTGEHRHVRPYKVETWDDIPDGFKDPDGAWVNDYGGYMSIGCDTARSPTSPASTTCSGPPYKGKVALNGTRRRPVPPSAA